MTKRRSQPKVKNVPKRTYGDKVRAGDMMFGGPRPHHRRKEYADEEQKQ